VGPPTVKQWGGLRVELVDLSWFSNPTSSLWVLRVELVVDLSWFSNPTSSLWDLLLSISWCAVSLFEQCTTTGVVLCSKCELASSFEQCTRLGQAWVQWQLLRELAKEFPCGH
jgi:hypothetical protein